MLAGGRNCPGPLGLYMVLGSLIWAQDSAQSLAKNGSPEANLGGGYSFSQLLESACEGKLKGLQAHQSMLSGQIFSSFWS